MVIQRSTSPDLLEPGLKAIFGLTYSAWVPEWVNLVDQLSSERAFEEFLGQAGFGQVPEKAEGSGVQYDDMLNGFKTTLVNLTYALGFQVTEEMIEDELYNVINQLPKNLAESVIDTVETLAANLYNNAFSPSFVFGDGVELCSLVHPLEGGGTFANEPATPADLSETSFEQGTIDIAAFVNGRNQKRRFRPTKLIVTPSDFFTASKLVGSDKEPETGNNAINPIKGILPQGFSVSHYLTDPDAWFLRTDTEGLVCLKRVWPAALARDNDFDSGNMKMKTRFRMVFGAFDPRSLYGNPGIG